MVHHTNRNPKHRRYIQLLNSPRWRNEVRVEQLRKHPYCQECLKQGIYRSAVDVHHITPVESVPYDDMERVCYSPDNLISLCVPCHIETHRRMHSHQGQVLRTMPQDQSQQADDLRAWVSQVSGGTVTAHVKQQGLVRTPHGWLTPEQEQQQQADDLEEWKQHLQTLGG